VRAANHARLCEPISPPCAARARTNGWPVAAHAGEATPSGLQHLLERATWDAAALPAAVRTQLGHPAGMLVIEETGVLNKGPHSVGGGLQSSPVG
jgi:hypothetical protein